MHLDHIFCMIAPNGPEIAALEAAGLHVTYRRIHHGQGTANACFVFDNAFLELLWVTSEADARSPAIARTGLWERSNWRTTHACPFGIAWRGQTNSIDTWAFAPPYLPSGVSIPVAIAGDDFRQPMMFQSPGKTPPTQWPQERQGNLQRAGGWTEMRPVELVLPSGIAASPTLHQLASGMSPIMKVTSGHQYGLRLRLYRPNGAAQVLELPQMTFGRLLSELRLAKSRRTTVFKLSAPTRSSAADVHCSMAASAPTRAFSGCRQPKPEAET